MKMRNILGDNHKCFGSMMVNAKGQVVIPASARRELGIQAGDTILVFGAVMGKHGLLLVKADSMEQMLSTMSEGLARIEEMIREQKQKVIRKKKEA
ncbi:MAG: AbrB/MazE/SpoVT family DNA-binding domain-containing protein [Dehalococcoidales bacterium]|jgi:AbrB family looped-hinge helix DNA binding protein|nr:AbrB/MazE/SpoVT family DNA-binding domain-containing protein [Dehalococcoidales bacterium]